MADEMQSQREPASITYVRVYADETGISHVGEEAIELSSTDYVSSAPPFDLSEASQPAGFRFATIPAGWKSDWHPSPRRQFFLQLSGVLEVELGDGQIFRTGPGSVTLIEDVGSKGHRTRVVGDVPVSGGFVHIGPASE